MRNTAVTGLSTLCLLASPVCLAPTAYAADDVRWEIGLPLFHVTSKKEETDKEPKSGGNSTSNETKRSLDYGSAWAILEPAVYFGDHTISTMILGFGFPFICGFSYGYQVLEETWVGPSVFMSNTSDETSTKAPSDSSTPETDESTNQNTKIMLNATKRFSFDSSGHALVTLGAGYIAEKESRQSESHGTDPDGTSTKFKSEEVTTTSGYSLAASLEGYLTVRESLLLGMRATASYESLSGDYSKDETEEAKVKQDVKEKATTISFYPLVLKATF